MSDAIRDTTPRATSKPPASHDDEGHSSTGGDSEVDTSFGASEDVAGNVKDTTHGDQAYKTEGKQKRKRTRYVIAVIFCTYTILLFLWSRITCPRPRS